MAAFTHSFPHYMEKQDKPMAHSTSVVGRMYDFAVELEKQVELHLGSTKSPAVKA